MTDPVESRPRRRGARVGLILLAFAAIAGGHAGAGGEPLDCLHCHAAAGHRGGH